MELFIRIIFPPGRSGSINSELHFIALNEKRLVVTKKYWYATFIIPGGIYLKNNLRKHAETFVLKMSSRIFKLNRLYIYLFYIYCTAAVTVAPQM